MAARVYEAGGLWERNDYRVGAVFSPFETCIDVRVSWISKSGIAPRPLRSQERQKEKNSSWRSWLLGGLGAISDADGTFSEAESTG
jgi:hypothetical protein